MIDSDSDVVMGVGTAVVVTIVLLIAFTIDGSLWLLVAVSLGIITYFVCQLLMQRTFDQSLRDNAWYRRKDWRKWRS